MIYFTGGKQLVKVQKKFNNYFFLIKNLNLNLKVIYNFSELYEFCLNENIADKNLIAKWKKQGYENLCCLRCIQTRDTNFGTNCICRVPKVKLEEVSLINTFKNI